MDNIYSAYHYSCKTKADREVVEELASKVIEAADKAAFGNIGDIQYTARTTTPVGGEWCDGATYTKAQYPVLYDMLVSGNLQYVDIATYNSVVELNGACGFFGLDVASQSFKVPTLTDVYIKAGQAAEEFSAESLPNITGTITNMYGGGGLTSNGAFSTLVNENFGRGSSSGGSRGGNTSIDASLSSSAYQDNAKVNPDHVTYRAYVVLYTGKDISFNKKEEYKLNNPFSLLDYKWSEYAIANSSWLISNGSFHSGAVYKSAYELLMKIYNGAETKDGVSVKLSTEEYSDTDFVIDTRNTTFRLPIKVKLASGNAVVGNGMTLGLTDGTNNYGLNSIETSSAVRLGASQGTYGTPVNSVISGNSSLKNTTLGVTTDPTKSGIETSSSGLKLYFYVGETIQDANVIAASGVLSEIANADYVVESYSDNSGNWYRVYKSGWVEQGGAAPSLSTTATTVTLLVRMKNKLYYANANYSNTQTTTSPYSVWVDTATETSIKIRGTNTSAIDCCKWFVCGYKA